MTIKQRLQSPTPRFFKKVRNCGLGVAALSAAILAAPVALPEFVEEAAGYIAVAATVASALSQATTGGKKHVKRRYGRFAK